MSKNNALNKVKETDQLDTLPLEEFLTYRLSRVQANLNAQATHVLREHRGLGLSQWRVISLLGANGKTSPGEMSRNVAIDKGLLSRTIKSLIEAGYVSSEKNPADMRQQLIELTSLGVKIHDQTMPHMQARQKVLLGSLTRQERSAIFSALDKLEVAARIRSFST